MASDSLDLGTASSLNTRQSHSRETTLNALNVTQINLQHCKAATDLLCKRFDTQMTDVSLIQEPWIRKGSIMGLSKSKYSLFSCQNSAHPRACILARKDISACLLPQLCDSDSVAILINIKQGEISRDIMLSSTYLPFDSSEQPPSNGMRKVIEYSKNKHIPLILGMDCNAHHIIWGSTDTNERGNSLLEYITSEQLEITNSGNKPTFVIKRRQEVIDITVCSRDIFYDITNWEVSNEVTLCDHRYICFQIARSPETPKTFRNPRRTNWDAYQTSVALALENTSHQSNTIEELDENVRFISQTMVSCFENNTPISKITGNQINNW